MRVRNVASWIIIVSTILFLSCIDGQGGSQEGSGSAEAEPVDQAVEEVTVANEPLTIEEWAEANNAQWIDERGFLFLNVRSPDPFPSAEFLDFVSLLRLNDSELQRIKEFGVSGTEISDPETIDFSRFTSLEKLSISNTNLDSLKWVEHLPIRSLGFGGAVKDILPIASLSRAMGIGIASTELFEVPDDLSKLVALETLRLEAPGLSSMEGIKTIPNPFTMSVVGVVKDGRYQYPDVEAFRSLIGSKAQGLYMHWQVQERYGETLQEIIEEVRKYTPDFFLAIPGT